jgi:DNA-binding MltR family transcriptional regulator
MGPINLGVKLRFELSDNLFRRFSKGRVAQCQKRDALRKLGKKFPAPPELERTLVNCRKESDRSAAIITTAIVESVLEKLIVKHLSCTESNLVGQLFNQRGPLSDFHSKILIATAFGVISPNTAAELHRVKAIRNVFAHATVEITFDTKEIAEEISTFLMLNAMKAVPRPPESEIDYPNKTAFLLMIQILCIVMDDQHRELGGAELFGDKKS